VSTPLSINGPRLVQDLTDLGAIGPAEAGGLSRTSFSAADREARAWYLARVAEAGLSAEVDGIGNIVVTSPHYPADIAALPAVWSGSHIDTVPSGGRFDGALGSIAALEVLRTIHESGVALARPVKAVVYTDEEGNYARLFGSSGLVRGYTREDYEGMVGRDGDRFLDTFADWGGDLDAALRTRIDPASVHATVELHIEQGPVLEQHGEQIGIVTGIVGLGGGEIVFHGQADHAGTTPMRMRKDALVAASGFLTRIPEIAATGGDHAVLTSGIISVAPGSRNVVPGTASLTLDYRDLDPANLVALGDAITAAAQEAAAAAGIEAEVHLRATIAPAPLDEGVQGVIARSAGQRGFATRRMPSGAGHDSQNMATIAPTGMIFVPSIGGRSHCPEEDTAWQDVENGANVLLDTVIELASS